MSLKLRLAALFAAMLMSGAAMAEPFRIIVTDTQAPLVPNSLLNLAAQEGYFARAGVEVSLVHVRQTPMAIAALQAGQGEMANISVSGLLDLHAQGADDVVAVHSSDKSLPYVIAARKDVTLADMAGKRFGVGQANSLDQTLSAIVLQRKGVSLGAMTLVPLGLPEVRGQALLAGRVDATTISIGTYLALPDRDGLHILVDVEDYFAAVPVVTKVDVVRRETLRTRGGDVEKVLEALTLAARDFAADPQRWSGAMERARPDVAPETLDELAGYYAHSWTVNGGLQSDELFFAQNWYTGGMETNTGYAINPMKWMDFGPMDAVLAKIGVSDAGDPVSRLTP